MLQTKPRHPVPSCCTECEFSYDLGDPHTVDMICCVRNGTHHKARQGLCDWYIRLGLLDLRLELAHRVPDAMKALEILRLPAPASYEAILNVIRGCTGPKLATVEEKDHEKPDPDNPT